MNGQASPLIDVAVYFGVLSLMAIGGASAVMPDMYRHAVESQGWMSANDFATLVALSQAAPGPNVLIVALLGWKVAGFPGGMVATACMCRPSSMLAYHFSDVWQRLKDSRGRAIAQAVLVPTAIGLILASAYLLARLVAVTITAVTIVLVVTTETHPLLLLGAAGLLGGLGLV